MVDSPKYHPKLRDSPVLQSWMVEEIFLDLLQL
jgi:hypothetical protein